MNQIWLHLLVWLGISFTGHSVAYKATMLAVSQYGPRVELNPYNRFFIERGLHNLKFLLNLLLLTVTFVAFGYFTIIGGNPLLILILPILLWADAAWDIYQLTQDRLAPKEPEGDTPE